MLKHTRLRSKPKPPVSYYPLQLKFQLLKLGFSDLAAAKDAEAALFRQAKEAEASLFRQAKEAEGQIKMADAALIRQTKEAEGLSKMAEAYGKMAQAFGGPQGLIQYLMVEKGVYGELARANAAAVQGMQPKMTIWNTGSNAGGNGDGRDGCDAAAAIRNTYQMLPPLMSTINEQTGITLPEWQFGKLATQLSGGVVRGGSGGSESAGA
jgi:flotillin